MTEDVYKFDEFERLKVENFRLQMNLMLVQKQNLDLNFRRLLDEIAKENDLIDIGSISLLPDFSGFSIKMFEDSSGESEDGQESTVCNEGSNDV